MRIISAAAVREAVRELCVEACCVLPEAVVARLRKARDGEAAGSTAQAVLAQLVENARLAREAMRPCCQDTGMAVVFLDIGCDAHIDGDVYAAVNEGVAQGYDEGYLRKSVLHPLTRVNTGDNTPAVVHIAFVPGDRVCVHVAPKGFGSENMGRLFLLTPSAGRQGVLDAIVETVVRAGACACPPVVAGVGIGGTMEQACLLAKRQLLRPLGEPSPEPDVAALEREALDRINATGIGPMGLGGRTTALAVHAAATPTHIAGLPVAVNLQCHACRHAERTL